MSAIDVPALFAAPDIKQTLLATLQGAFPGDADIGPISSMLQAIPDHMLLPTLKQAAESVPLEILASKMQSDMGVAADDSQILMEHMAKLYDYLKTV